ncbi:MAG: nucleotide sugar dehydrogenase [Candidatus Neomarinimicrobiota bacterium]|nr:MAG: nucleotide sugar dehydrogenase [Candidatus Neomarinimicrobiota bacterium]
MQALLTSISDRTTRIGIIGLGYVGLPLAVEFARAGFSVTGLDIDRDRVRALNRGENPIADVDDEILRDLVAQKRFRASDDFSRVAGLDALSICVPTPLNKLKDPDISHILDVLNCLQPHLHRPLLVVLESTTYPGTTRELVLPALENSGLKVGKDFFLCFSPERIDPGNATYSVANTPKVIGGITPECTRVGQALYETIITRMVPVSSPEAAEMTKLLENTYRSINIALVNEMALMAERLGVDIWEIIDAAATKPFGFTRFTPGPGLGGHCIPIDPHYLAWKMKTLDYRARFIELAGEINTQMPHHVVNLIYRGLNARSIPLSRSSILLVGVAYKPDIDDVRESPALDIMKLLEEGQARVDYYDPFVPVLRWNGGEKPSVSPLSPEELEGRDAVVIVTHHSSVDYDLIRRKARLIVDTRNVYAGIREPHILRLGVGPIQT